MCVIITCDVGGDAVPASLIAPTQPEWLPQGSLLAFDPAPHPPMPRSPMTPPPMPRHPQPGQLPPTLPGDAAAVHLARRLADGFDAPLVVNPFSPDLVDVGRSPHHRELFPKMTRRWSAESRQSLLDEVYFPYRRRVRRTIAESLLRYSFAIHLSVRTFESRSKGKPRRADLGLLYDPSSEDELDFCLEWMDELYDEAEMLRVRRNYPRRGTTDSLTKAMRAEFAGTQYLGIELMANRAWVGRDVSLRDRAIDGIVWSLRAITDDIAVEAA